MKIGFDVSQTGRGRAGCGSFADALARALVASDPESTYVLYSTFGTRYWDDDHLTATTRIQADNVRRGLELPAYDDSVQLWRRTGNEVEEALGRPEVLHANNYFCPPHLPTARLVYTLYDMVAVEHANFLTEETRLTCFDGLFEASLRADALVAISRHTRDRFHAVFPHYPLDRIRVVYPGNRFANASAVPEAPVAGLARGRFWLTVGTIEPRKNLRRVLSAYARLCEEQPDSPPLVVAGGPGWKEEGLVAYIRELGISDRTMLLGYVTDASLQWLYTHCFAFVYVSLVEGFGLPVVEALGFGAPVITSSTSSLPEVAGTAALTVDPTDVEALAAAMTKISEPAVRRHLAAGARDQASRFSWTAAAREVRALYDEVFGRERYAERL